MSRSQGIIFFMDWKTRLPCIKVIGYYFPWTGAKILQCQGPRVPSFHELESQGSQRLSALPKDEHEIVMSDPVSSSQPLVFLESLKVEHCSNDQKKKSLKELN